MRAWGGAAATGMCGSMRPWHPHSRACWWPCRLFFRGLRTRMPTSGCRWFRCEFASDRLIRFIAASAVFHAVFSGATYWFHRGYTANHKLVNGLTPWYELEVLAVTYVAVPWAAGSLVGYGHTNGWRWTRFITGTAPEPRAWDFVWNRRSRSLVRLRLKSRQWLAGTFATSPSGLRSYASGYPEEGELFLSQQLQVDARTGAWVKAKNGKPQLVSDGSSLLIRWSEIEYIEHREF